MDRCKWCLYIRRFWVHNRDYTVVDIWATSPLFPLCTCYMLTRPAAWPTPAIILTSPEPCCPLPWNMAVPCPMPLGNLCSVLTYQWYYLPFLNTYVSSIYNVNTRTAKPAENFESLFKPNWGHVQNQDLKMLRRMADWQLFLRIWNQRRECKKQKLPEIHWW